MFEHITEEMQTARTEEKNAEFTYGVHGPSLLELVPDNAATILSQEESEKVIFELNKSVTGSVRSLNEKFGLLRQAIMYSFFWRLHPEKGVQFFVYRRTKRNNEGQLAQRLSLGAGGHFELTDINRYFCHQGDYTQVIDFPGTCTENYYRERGEELDGDDRTFSPYENPTLHGFVMDSQPKAGYVGNIHFDMLVGAKMVNETIELQMKEAQNDAEGWFTPDELRADLARGGKVIETEQGDGLVDYEPWSKLIIEKIEDLVASLELDHAA